MRPKILVLHGPNLNLLGEREPEIYGTLTLEELNTQLRSFAIHLSCDLEIFQSNTEGTLIDLLHEHRKAVSGVVFNPGALAHYSYALRDAISAVQVRVVEVHLSKVNEREDFRKISVIKDVCFKTISGRGPQSYTDAIQLLCSP